MTNHNKDLLLSNNIAIENKDPNVLRLFIIRHGQTDCNKQKILQGHLNTTLNAEGVEQAKACGARFANVQIDGVSSSDLTRCVQTTNEIVRFHKVLNPGVEVDTVADGQEQVAATQVDSGTARVTHGNNIAQHGSASYDTKAKGVDIDSGKGFEIHYSLNFRERTFGPVEGMKISEAIEWASKQSVVGVNGQQQQQHGVVKTYKDFGESREQFRIRLFNEVLSLITHLLNSEDNQNKKANDDDDEKVKEFLDLEENKTKTYKNYMLVTHGGSIRTLLDYFANGLHLAINEKLVTQEATKVVYNTSVTIVDFFKQDLRSEGKLKGIIQLVGDTKHLGKQLEVQDQRIR